jgi:hypothetical protein
MSALYWVGLGCSQLVALLAILSRGDHYRRGFHAGHRAGFRDGRASRTRRPTGRVRVKNRALAA